MPPRFATTLDACGKTSPPASAPRPSAPPAAPSATAGATRVLDPVTTVYLFLLQVLHGNTACQHVVHFGGWTFTASAYCQARQRLPLAVLQHLLERHRRRACGRPPTAGRWRGHRVWLVDGSSFSMPDTPELRRHFGQPGRPEARVRLPGGQAAGLFDVATGMLLRVGRRPAADPRLEGRPGDVPRRWTPGDVVLGDRGFCSYAHLAMLAAAGRARACSASTSGRSSTSPRAAATCGREQSAQPRGPARARGGSARSGERGPGGRVVQARGAAGVDDGRGVRGAARGDAGRASCGTRSRWPGSGPAR